MKERICCLAIFLFLGALSPHKSQGLITCVNSYDEAANGGCLTSSCSTGCSVSGGGGSGGGFGGLVSTSAPTLLPDRIELFANSYVSDLIPDEQRHPKILSNGDADFNLLRPTSRIHLRSFRAYIEPGQQRKGV
jgi:hypothetical protein